MVLLGILLASSVDPMLLLHCSRKGHPSKENEQATGVT